MAGRKYRQACLFPIFERAVDCKLDKWNACNGFQLLSNLDASVRQQIARADKHVTALVFAALLDSCF